MPEQEKPQDLDDLLVSCPNQGGLLSIKQGEVQILDKHSTTGLALDGDCLYRGIQRARDPLLVMQRLVIGEISQRVIQVPFLDLHTLYLRGDCLYAVSTGHNEVVIVHIPSRLEIFRWKFPGSGDAWHISSLGFWEDKPVVTVFGRFQTHREFKGQTHERGYIINLLSGALLRQNLSEPHSVFGNNDICGFCNSKESTLWTSTQSILHTGKTFRGYTRGVAVGRNYIYLGLSMLRHPDQKLPPRQNCPMGTILVLDKVTLKEKYTIPLPFSEVFEILITNHVSQLALESWILKEESSEIS